MDNLRLYLDTADLIMIGDGKEDPTVVADLFHHCERLDVVLAASLWHVADARNAPDDARARIVAAIDAFPRRALVRLGDTGGLIVWPIASLQNLLDEHGDDVNTLLAQAKNAASVEESVQPPTHVPAAHLNLVKKLALEVLSNAKTKAEAVNIALAFVHKHRRRIAPQQAESMLQAMETMWTLRENLDAVGVWDPQLVVDAFTKVEVTNVGERPLGKHVSVLIDQRRRGQLDRKYQTGDLADRNHAEYAPYVDIFTGDLDICTWLVEWRSKINFERHVIPIRNRQLRKVVEVLAQR